MTSFQPWEWLALQRRYYAKPKQGIAFLNDLYPPFTKAEQEQADKDWRQCQQRGYRLILWESPNYPALLKEIYDPPLVLMAKGKVEVLQEREWFSVVGARKASRWGREKTKEIVKELAAQGLGIISGLAYGIDSEAHQAALEFGGSTFGVLGSSLDRLYPARHAWLATKMEKQGGLLSEFPLGTGPEAFHFPQRNRIISGLAKAVVVVEATAKSGSLITARFALEQGRDVYVVPPPSDDVRYEGNIRLLEEGATPIGGTYAPKQTEPEAPQTHWLLDFLRSPQNLETLIAKTHKPCQEILSALTQLESLGSIDKKPGPLWQSR